MFSNSGPWFECKISGWPKMPCKCDQQWPLQLVQLNCLELVSDMWDKAMVLNQTLNIEQKKYHNVTNLLPHTKPLLVWIIALPTMNPSVNSTFWWRKRGSKQETSKYPVGRNTATNTINWMLSGRYIQRHENRISIILKRDRDYSRYKLAYHWAYVGRKISHNSINSWFDRWWDSAYQ